jgi:3-oxoacyl-[acyl-carrier-protein] synthase-1
MPKHNHVAGRVLQDTDLVITGRALVGALGPDAVTACAAFRAGISRATELDYFDGGGPSQAEASLRVHSAGGLTHGFVGPARLSRLLAGCVRDLAGQAVLQDLDARRVGCFVAMPAPGRTLEGAMAIDEPELRAQQLTAASEAHIPSDREYAAAVLARGLFDTPWQRLANNFVAVSAGHAGVAQACLAAAEQLQLGAIETALVFALDSLLDVDTLEWLSLLKRLRTEDRPAGVVPGEACCALVLQSAVAARRHGRQALVTIKAIGTGSDPRNILTGQASTGAVMAGLIDDVKQHCAATEDDCWFLVDHNGETARAAEWGNSLFHLTRRHASYVSAHVQFPAIGFGDTAAASGGVAVCIAISAWERGYAPSARAFICSTADGAPRAVLCLQASPGARG